MKVPICPYCGKPSELLPNSAEIYRGRDYGPVWICRECEAWVGCHPGTHNALGRLANKELRTAKVEAHAAFDRLWKAKMAREKTSKHRARNAGYAWLAARLGIEATDCHIGMFDAETCRRVVEVCAPYRAKKRREEIVGEVA